LVPARSRFRKPSEESHSKTILLFWSQIGFSVHLKGASVTLGRDLTGSSVMWRKSVSEPSA